MIFNRSRILRLFKQSNFHRVKKQSLKIKKNSKIRAIELNIVIILHFHGSGFMRVFKKISKSFHKTFNFSSQASLKYNFEFWQFLQVGAIVILKKFSFKGWVFSKNFKNWIFTSLESWKWKKKNRKFNFQKSCSDYGNFWKIEFSQEGGH